MSMLDPFKILACISCAVFVLACGDDKRSELFSDVDALGADVPSTPGAAPSADAPVAAPVVAPVANDSSELGPTPVGLEAGELQSQGLPCGVKGILQENCVGCHAATPQFGAPMPLVSYADLTAPAVSQPSRSVYDLVLERIANDAAPMPPVPNDRLSVDERAALRSWVQGGTPQVEEICRAIEQSPPPEATFPFPDADRCDVLLDLEANDGAVPFTVPQEDDHYECFYFKGPVEPVQLLGLSPIIDDSRVIHHWLLFTNNDGSLTDRTRASCSGIHPDATLLGGWAPGGLEYGMPEGVGVEVPSGDDARFILEIHYNNVARHADARDSSGVRLCATRTPQPKLAAVHWLGTENIFLLPGQSNAGSTCAPEVEEPVHILRITPHMHQLGVHSSMVLERANGSEETLLDEPFDFNSQTSYESNAVLQPGDRLRATCSWNNDSGGLTTFGPSSDDEMCYLFTLAYPAGSLSTGGNFLLGGLLGGVNKCMR